MITNTKHTPEFNKGHWMVSEIWGNAGEMLVFMIMIY